MPIDEQMYNWPCPGFSRNGFHAALLNLNRLNWFSKWFFYPGMLFNTQRIWWPGKNKRASKHEGLDLACFLSLNNCLHSLSAGLLVPAAFPGKVGPIIQDFLGVSIFLEHTEGCSREFVFCSVYAHLKPDKGLKPGQMVDAGQVLGQTASTGNKTKLPPHLHLSLGWFSSNILPAISWPLINKREGMHLIDPLPHLGLKYEISKQLNS